MVEVIEYNAEGLMLSQRGLRHIIKRGCIRSRFGLGRQYGFPCLFVTGPAKTFEVSPDHLIPIPSNIPHGGDVWIHVSEVSHNACKDRPLARLEDFLLGRKDWQFAGTSYVK
jgi:hypothetical protein